jgi:hypothetical protein
MTGRQLRQCAVLALLCLAGCAYTKITNIGGSVLDANTRAPVAGATVDLYGRDNAEEHLVTDQNGRFNARGSYSNWGFYPHIKPSLRIRVSADGYDVYIDERLYGSFNAYHSTDVGAILLSRPGEPPAGEFEWVSCRRYIYDLDRHAPYLQSYYEAHARKFLADKLARSNTVYTDADFAFMLYSAQRICRNEPSFGYEYSLAVMSPLRARH